jgi:DNA-binding helix-hairpin-helix protein with protein kinase domain
MVLPQLSQAEAADVWDYYTILDQIAWVYNNPNKVREAEDRLLLIKQGDDSLQSYIAKFERLLYEANA